MFKKIISLLISVLLVSSLTTALFAADSTVEVKTPEENIVVINEYEYLKELSLKSESELYNMGLSAKEIQNLSNFHQDYVNHLNKLKKLDDAALLEHGYTLEQIKMLRDFDGSESQAIILSAKLTLSTTTLNFRRDGTYTRGSLSYSWFWNGVPFFGMRDAVAVSWNDWVVESNTSWVRYHSIHTGQFYTEGSKTFTLDNNGTRGAGHRFPLKIEDNYYFARYGGGRFNIRSDVHALKDFYYYIAYGHSQIWPTIGFSIGIGGASASISFTAGTNIVDHHTGNYIFR